MRLFVALAACLLLGACTTTSTRLAATGSVSTPAANSKVLLVEPDVQLSLLLASGLQEPRADWSTQGRESLQQGLKTALEGKTHRIEALDPQASMAGRTGQLLRLNEAVGGSILAFNYGAVKLPSKHGVFEWTLGQGAQVIGTERSADYALFVTGRGTYSSAGRKALMIGAAMLGVSVPLGSQQVFASLVDLKTGQVVWFGVAMAGPQADMRSAEGATALVTSLLKGAPL